MVTAHVQAALLRTDCGRDRRMCEISERIARAGAYRPHAVALHRGDASLSYAELNRRANRLASHLVLLGVRAGETVAICLERSFEQIVASLAVMRAGAVYVPLDPAWPMERTRAIVADSGAVVFVASRERAAKVGGGSIGLCPVEDGAVIAAAAPEFTEAAADAEALAYVIYTSGSTGAPKGVEITHGNLSALIEWHTERFGVTAADRASHLAGLGFDASVWEVWPYLAVGASVSLVDEEARTSPELLLKWMVEQEITVGFVPTALAEPMMTMEWPETAALRYLLTGGDTLHTAPRACLPFAVVNCYGPTECTVVATSGTVAQGVEGLPSIGRAIAGTRIYVLDEAGGLVPDGETGELCIGGSGVGRGYRNLPELTAQCFVADPFSGKLGGRMYRTGDRAAVRSDGQIEFRGRVDGQEKIRGQRLELNEIVCVLNRHPAVAFNVVEARGEGIEKRLVAYVLLAGGAETGARELQTFLAETLPGVMVPATFVRLARLPLSANGKVDVALLPVPSEENALREETRRAPCSTMEEMVLAMIQGLLKTKDVGVEDDFFLVGGHSLLGTQLVMRVREGFGVLLTLRDLFECATAAQLAERVEEMLIAEMDGITDEEAARLVAMSFSELRAGE